MNFPMLYWFIPRELVFLVKLALIGFLIFSAYLVVRWVRNSAPPGPRRKLRLGLFFGLVVLPIVVLLVGNQIMEERQIEARKQYVKDAWAHFHQRCESAHVTYFKSVPPQDGVFIMKPAKWPTSKQFKDQYWMGDPVDLPDTPEKEARGLLYRQKSLPKGSWDERNGQGGFDYVEAPHPDDPNTFVRFKLRPNGEKDYNGYGIHEVGDENVTKRLSRYGYTWDDISTPEDRKYWVAGGRLRVVELDTGEVVAERVGYVIEPNFGATSSTFNQEPWLSAHFNRADQFHDYDPAWQTVCQRPIDGKPQGLGGRRDFISTALGTWNELDQQGEIK